jgi:transcriptional regulator with XRE-family HTH domain
MLSRIEVPSTIIANLLLGACPEREGEVAKFWDQFQPRFVLKQDGVGSGISACGSKVSWMYKMLAHDWVVAFAGFKAQTAYVPHLLLGEMTGRKISAQALRDDDELNNAEAALGELLYFAKSILVVDDIDELEWPPGLPRPGMNRDELNNNEDKACFDIACLATAASFLHELRNRTCCISRDSNMPRKSKTASENALAVRIGSNIKIARTALALTQGQLAEKLGVENVTISRIETGAQMPSIDRLDEIARALQVPLPVLFGDKSSSGGVGEMLVELLSDLPAREQQFIYEFAARYAQHWKAGKKR